MDLLLEERFTELRKAICATSEEWRRFRALVVNSVMATDLGDKQLKELRNGRWQTAFTASEKGADDEEAPEDRRVSRNRKATIVVEHLIQAAGE